jgi:hypothetical protein
VDAVGQGGVDQPVDAGIGEGRLGPAFGEQLEAAPGTAGQHEGEDRGLGMASQDRAGADQYQPWVPQKALALSAVP